MCIRDSIWDANSRHAVCGFFFPQIWDYEPFIEDGNSLLFASWKDDYDKKREMCIRDSPYTYKNTYNNITKIILKTYSFTFTKTIKIFNIVIFIFIIYRITYKNI